ncbi:MAG: bifunctional phosphopantothenoylcysteine decarboxylase/phosphopantothenate--cysteine ligase CoaBC [Gammaproteobacteria bacterium]
MQSFLNKNILLCITGGIAAYKSAEILRLFKKNGADIRIVMTEAAKEFITPLTMQALSGNPIHNSLLDEKAEAAMSHIELAKWADIIIIAPCTAETMSKLAHGRADDLMGAVILASNAKTFIAPAMNVEMWQDPVTQNNLNILSKRDLYFIGPASGEQACGDVGDGRMEEPLNIFNFIKNKVINNKLQNIKITITAGPTREQIDPVRYISNNSSGKMGYALADAAIEEGADVILISGPVSLRSNPKAKLISINSADELLNEAYKAMESSDIFISCAAVADYKPLNNHDNKIKKNKDEMLDITLTKNPDILSSISEKYPDKFIVGFAAETENVEDNAKDKLINKNLNMIVANDVSDTSIGFDSDNNEVMIITQNKSILAKKDSKLNIARNIIDLITKEIKDVITN